MAINSALRTITGCQNQNRRNTVLANPCWHCPSSSPTKCPYPPTRHEVTEHFNNNLVRLKTRPRLKSRRPFAQSAIELMESFAGHESIAQLTQHQWLEEWKKSGDPPHSLPPPKVGNPDLGLSLSAWCKLNHLRTRVGSSGNQVCTFHDGCKQGIDQQIFNRN